MSQKPNKLSNQQAFQLAIAIKNRVDSKQKKFESWDQAEAFFTKAVGFIVTKYNIESAAKSAGVEPLDIKEAERPNAFMAMLSEKFAVLSARCDELEKRCAAAEARLAKAEEFLK